MSANPTKMMLVNCSVNQIFNFFTPANINPTVTMVMVCWNCRCILPHPSDAEYRITCDFCKAITLVRHHDPHSALPRQHSAKKAVICGISYQKSSPELNCIKYAKRMKDLLIKSFQFSESAIVMLTEEETDQFKTPTKNNLLSALYWLGQGCQPGDSLVFHYCGPGLRLRNYRLGGVEGYNETLCPMDFESEGMIFDDEINSFLVGHLPPNVKLHAIIDSCHRDSVLDLRCLCRKNSGQYKWEKPRPDVSKGTSGGDAISFSCSVDVPTSADTPLLSKTTSPGLMTSCFIKAIEGGPRQTYRSILNSMQKTITKTGGKLRQEPLLSACGPFDVNKTFAL